MTAPRTDAAGVDLAQLTDHLRGAGAVFAYLHGSRVAGTARPDSDLDVAAWFGRAAGCCSTPTLPPVDEQPRRDQARRDFAQAHRRG